MVKKAAPEPQTQGAPEQVGEFHPAHPLLDQIETMVAFASPEVNHTVCAAVKKIRALL